jgi:hypothetical protein
MRVIAIIAAVVLLGTPLVARQSMVDYVITPHIFALAGPGSEEATIIGKGVLLRTTVGKPAVIDTVNRDRTDGNRLVIIPTDLGAGRFALRVEFTLVRPTRRSTADFDLLSGPQTQPPTVALRDAQGAFIKDDLGRQLYATFDVVTKER